MVVNQSESIHHKNTKTDVSMSVSMSSRDASDLGVTTTMTTNDVTPSDQVDSVYELARCHQWITSQSLTRVALQFPDSLLQDSHTVTSHLQV